MYTPFLFSTSETDLHYVLLHKKETEAFPIHWHDEFEITYVNSGELRISINGENYLVKAGDGVIINSGDCHYCFPSKAEITAVLFSPNLLSSASGSEQLVAAVKERLKENAKTTVAWSDEDRKTLLSILSELERLDSGSFSYPLLVRSLLFRLLALLTDDGHARMDKDESIECSKVRDRIGNVFKYIEEHYMESITLATAAEASGYVPTYFSRVFKICTGMTFYDYLTVYRIRKAEILLINTNDSISKVAVATGFSSVKTFDRVFKEQRGISPLKFRKQHTIKSSERKHRKEV